MNAVQNGIRCAHCKAYHNTIEEVKECSRNFHEFDRFEQAMTTPIRENKKRASIKPGRYAIQVEGEWKFYMVDLPTNGRWVGYTFLYLQAGRDYWPVKNRGIRSGILDLILKDPQQAMADYGRWIGRCGHCNRVLTNAASRAAGIGPVCAAKMGW